MGVLIGADKVGIGCDGWVVRAILSEVSEVLAERGYEALAGWISDENGSVQRYDRLDARTLTPPEQEACVSALLTAQERSQAKGPAGWRSVDPWQGYSALFASLASQARQAARGEPPTSGPTRQRSRSTTTRIDAALAGRIKTLTRPDRAPAWRCQQDWAGRLPGAEPAFNGR